MNKARSDEEPRIVVPGLVPGIHAERKPPTSKVYCNGAAWVAGTSPAKTLRGSIPLRFSRAAKLYCSTGQPWNKSGHDGGEVLGVNPPRAPAE